PHCGDAGRDDHRRSGARGSDSRKTAGDGARTRHQGERSAAVRIQYYKRELAAASAYAVLLALVATAAPSFFSSGNLRDLALNNAPTLLVATGMTLVILAGKIDISVGSQFAVASVAAGMLAKTGMGMALVLLCVMAAGAMMGAVNGALVGRLGLP